MIRLQCQIVAADCFGGSRSRQFVLEFERTAMCDWRYTDEFNFLYTFFSSLAAPRSVRDCSKVDLTSGLKFLYHERYIQRSCKLLDEF